MQLNVDFTELTLAAAKMHGLDGFLSALRTQKLTYDDGLKRAVEFVHQNNGDIIELADNQTKLSFAGEEAICFQPYADIDLFYFES